MCIKLNKNTFIHTGVQMKYVRKTDGHPAHEQGKQTFLINLSNAGCKMAVLWQNGGYDEVRNYLQNFHKLCG